MTKIFKENMKIDCPICNQIHEATYYDTVNVQKNPELREKVFNGEINILPCKNNYLFKDFLYVDGNNWIWLYPTFKKDQKDSIELQMKEMDKGGERMFGKNKPTQYLVFGYDEFYDLTEKLKINEDVKTPESQMFYIKEYSKSLVDDLSDIQDEDAKEVANHKAQRPLINSDQIKIAIIQRRGWKQLNSQEYEFTNGEKLLIEKNDNITDGCIRLSGGFRDATRKIAEIELNWLTKDMPEDEREKIIEEGLEEVDLQLDIEDTINLIPFIRKKIM